MSGEMDEAREIFRNECDDLLQDMEQGLLDLEHSPENRDAINAIFRAAHTIKGSAGVFGFEHVVEFTHVVESLLDKIRDDEIAVTDDVIAILLKSGDHLAALVDYVTGATDAEADPPEDLKNDSYSIMDTLKEVMGGDAVATSEVPATAEQASADESAGKQIMTTDNWDISVKFGSDVLRNGMDPLSFIRYLQNLGEIVYLKANYEAMPAMKYMDPEACYMAYDITMNTTATREEIVSVFEFVLDDCDLKLKSPSRTVESSLQTIRDLPEDTDKRLGELLIEGGVLTEKELKLALEKQCKQAEKGKQPPIGEMLVKEGLVEEKVVNTAVERQQEIRQKRTAESRSMRVDADKLDQLINLVGELVISSSSSFLLAQKSGDDDLIESISNTSRLVEEIRDSSLRLRMVQIGDTFKRFHRVVRDVSKELGKEINLNISGAEAELDKTVVEKIADPLMHLVRNAMDHGIESKEVRIAHNKPEVGTVSLNAYYDSGSVVIEVSDDGGGLNRDKILAKAVNNGLIKEGTSLTDHEVNQLIFEAGFSTADAVTNLSGRGVGMDVVKRNIESLRGSVDISSVQGEGSTVTIRLPLTLAIIDGFLVSVGRSSYVIPLDMIVECVELSKEGHQVSVGHDYINLRGEVLPFIRLREAFDEGLADNRKQENIVVVEYAGKRAGFVVDELLGEFQTVIKPLGKLFSALQGVSGATILGGGDVAVILDVPNLVQRSVNKETQMSAPRLGVDSLH